MSDPLRILALDLATRTGWATNCDCLVESGVQDFSLKRGESPGMRWIAFNLWIGEMLARLKPQVVVFEQPFIGTMRSGTVAEIAYGMSTRVQQDCAVRGIEFRPVGNSVVKKHATGNGNSGKETMMLAAAGFLESLDGKIHMLYSSDEADALCILAWALDGMQESAAPPTRKRKAKVAA